METLIRIGGIYNIGLILFHLSFWRIFNWNEELDRVSFLNRAVMQVLNISLMFAFAIFAYISLVYTSELMNSPLGNSLLVLMALFWLARSVQQLVFYKLKHWLSWLFLLLFMTGCLLYAIPAASLLRGL
jgi:hypothetical protein